MSIAAAFVAYILPYITIAAFLGGLIYRIYGWWRAPVPFPLSVTYPKTRGEQIKNIASEILVFPQLLRNDRNLWIGAWPFHAALALIIIGHARLFSGFPDRVMMALGMSAAQIKALSAALGSAVGIVIFVALIYLFVRRLTQKTVRDMSNVADYFVLLWLLAIVMAGNYMRFSQRPEIDILEVRAFLQSIFALSPIAPPDNPVFLLHFFLVQMLLITLPFTKLIHPIGIFFTQSIKHSFVVLKHVR